MRWDQLLESMVVFPQVIDCVHKLPEKLMRLVEDTLQKKHILTLKNVNNVVSLLR